MGDSVGMAAVRKACCVCECPISRGEKVTWSLVKNGEHLEFSVDVCAVDAALCGVFPSLRSALWKSEVTQELLRRAVGL